MHSQPTAVEQDIRRLEVRRYDAMKGRDYVSLADLCHRELIYTHSNGQRDTLDSFIANCQDGIYIYHEIDHPVEQIKVFGDIGLVVGAMKAEMTVAGKPKVLDNRSLAVWIRQQGSWKLLAYQATPRQPCGDICFPDS